MKAYKVIFELIKHPFADVYLIGRYTCTHVRYNSFYKGLLLESISDKPNRTVEALKRVAEYKQSSKNNNITSETDFVRKS